MKPLLKPHWEHYPHQADMGVRGYGPGPEQAFEQAALAMMAVMLDPATVRPRHRVRISCRAPDDEMLLFDWLNALVFEMATRGMVFCRFEVAIEGQGPDVRALNATAWGEPFDRRRHPSAVEVKGATMTDLGVSPVAGGWQAQCIVDV